MMKILIAEDEPVSRRIIQSLLVKWGYEVVVTHNGVEAWEAIQSEGAPLLVILDWMMPGMDGAEVCQKIRQSDRLKPIYIILLTAKDRKEDLVTGLQAGANDYITKPFDVRELHVRIQVGQRMLELQQALTCRVKELEVALSNVKQLQGLLPICSYCKKIRNDGNYWEQVDKYIVEHSEVQFSHGICPDCYQKVVKPELEKLKPPV
ncbi:MAG: response regulator transcription factor [Thermodesulfobacteriota bacterium]|nr:response regulator transcription factor [Thermodesulfobacteriota bacterium]